MNQHENDACNVQCLENDFYFGALGYFDHSFTPW